MNTLNLRNRIFAASLLTLSACGQPAAQLEETCTQAGCSEKTINAPVPAVPTSPTPPVAMPPSSTEPSTAYRFPMYTDDFQMPRGTFERAEEYYNLNIAKIKNTRYVTIIDFSQPSTHKRMYIFDLKTGKLEQHATSHGKNSDPDNDGYPTKFSNTPDSLQSSLGFYLTLATYSGSHGYSLRLRGLEKTNNNAEDRAIVMHPADYVSDSKSTAGRSWGCPALDPKISKSVIDKVKEGSLLYIDYDTTDSRSP